MTVPQREKILLNKHLLKTQDFRDLLEKPLTTDFLNENSNLQKYEEKNLLYEDENNYERESFIKYMEKDKDVFLNKEDSEMIQDKLQKITPTMQKENITSQKNLEFLNNNMMETQKYCFPTRPISSSFKKTRPELRIKNIINCLYKNKINILIIFPILVKKTKDLTEGFFDKEKEKFVRDSYKETPAILIDVLFFF